MNRRRIGVHPEPGLPSGSRLSILQIVENEADIPAILDERHEAVRQAFLGRNLEAYRAAFSAGLSYRQADGRVIDRDRLMRDVAAQFRRLDWAESRSVREALAVEGAEVTETVRQTALGEVSAFGLVGRTWQVDRRARWTWAIENGVWTIVRVEVLSETVRGGWRFGRRGQAPT